jgi:hypothetical protein
VEDILLKKAYPSEIFMNPNTTIGSGINKVPIFYEKH